MTARWTLADLAARGYHVPLAQDTPEGTLLARVRGLAKELSYISYHTHDSRRSESGFPDLCLARPAGLHSAGRLIFAELKTAKGQVTEEQALWMNILQHTVPGLECYVWRPADFAQIIEILSRK